jgi:flagellar basal-body rod protein FlgG
MDAQGKLQMSNGAKLIPEVNIPPNALNITVTGSGEIRAAIPNGGETTIGQIQLITFQNEQGLEAKGDSLYLPTLASGAPLQGVPGENGMGLIQQGALEGSNVSIANSMIDMIKANRMFEANSKAIQTVSEMMGQTANLK